MKKLILSSLILFSLSSHAFESNDRVMKIERIDKTFQVSFALMARVYQISITDKNLPCLMQSISKKEEVKINVDMEKGLILKCSLLRR